MMMTRLRRCVHVHASSASSLCVLARHCCVAVLRTKLLQCHGIMYLLDVRELARFVSTILVLFLKVFARSQID